MKQVKCVVCRKRTQPSGRRIVKEEIKNHLQKKSFVEVKEGDCICSKCLLRFYRTVQPEDPSDYGYDDNDDEEYIPSKRKRVDPPQSPRTVSVAIPSTSESHAYCFVCRKPGPRLIVVSSQLRLSVFVGHNILIPEGSRCCPGHVKDGTFSTDIVKQLKTTSPTVLSEDSVGDILQKLRDIANRNSSVRLDFDSPDTLSESDYMHLTGLTMEQFNDLCQYVNKTVRNTPARTSRTSLAIFLMKMKSGMANKLLSTLFNITKSSVRRSISSIRKALMTNFVPNYLGFKHITRETVINDHTRPLAQTIFGDSSNAQAILVIDGTYIYIQKSNNFLFQRRSFSLHKGRPLVKPMVVVTTTGYFVSVIGPYLADTKNNDASILNHMLKTNIEEIKTWINEDDVFIVDRGFRDSLQLLEELGIRAEMPAFMTKGSRQMSTEDANASRLVTKVRWVIESANARIKSWKYLDKILPTNQVPYIGDYIKILCAASNKYFRDLSICMDPEADVNLACKMLYMSKQNNTLKSYVEDNGLDKRSAKWKSADEVHLSEFPQLDEQQLRDLTCGTYQLKRSSSYLQEHVDGESQIHLHEEEPNLLRIRIQSRHVSAKTYLLWIKYDPSSIQSWYCKCRAGARVVGVCAHIACML